MEELLENIIFILRKNLKKTNYGRIGRSRSTPTGAYNEGILFAIGIVEQALEVCPKDEIRREKLEVVGELRKKIKHFNKEIKRLEKKL